MQLLDRNNISIYHYAEPPLTCIQGGRSFYYSVALRELVLQFYLTICRTLWSCMFHDAFVALMLLHSGAAILSHFIYRQLILLLKCDFQGRDGSAFPFANMQSYPYPKSHTVYKVEDFSITERLLGWGWFCNSFYQYAEPYCLRCLVLRLQHS